MQSIHSVAIVVRDYDEAIAYYTGKLGFELLQDERIGPTKRWVRVAPAGGHGTNLLLAQAAKPEQLAAVGNQTGGRVFLFLHTDDLERDYTLYRERGVEFIEQPRREDYGRVVVFTDLYGNKWDLVQPAVQPRREPLLEETPIASAAELKKWLNRELGYCDCAYADSLQLLQQYLQLVAERSAASVDRQRFAELGRTIEALLDLNASSGMRSWFVYSLDRANLISHGLNVYDAWITERGKWILAGLKLFGAELGAGGSVPPD